MKVSAATLRERVYVLMRTLQWQQPRSPHTFVVCTVHWGCALGSYPNEKASPPSNAPATSFYGSNGRG